MKGNCSRPEELTDEKISRVTRSKEEAEANYNQMSTWYDMVARFEKKCKDVGLQKLHVIEGETVLEVGFGTGDYVVALAQAVGTSGKVYGIDIAQGMINVALSKVEKKRLSERVELKHGDAVSLPFEADFFDAVLMNFTLELFDTTEIPQVLNECKRVLRSGGRICVVALSRKRPSFMVRFYEWVHTTFPKYVDCRPIFVQKAVEEAHFCVLDVTDMAMWGLPVEIVLAQKK